CRRPHSMAEIEYMPFERQFPYDMLDATPERNAAPFQRHRIEISLDRAMRHEDIPHPFKRQGRFNAETLRFRLFKDHFMVESRAGGKHDDRDARSELAQSIHDACNRQDHQLSLQI